MTITKRGRIIFSTTSALYFLTILLNAAGILCSMGLFFISGIKAVDYLPIIIAGCVVFTVSFTFTVLDFNKKRKPRKNYKIVYECKHAIEDYGDYLKTHKYDFII